MAGDLDPGDDLPMSVADIADTPCIWGPLTTFANELGVDPSVYVCTEAPNTTEILWQIPNVMGSIPREYRFRMLRNLNHAYPSGGNWGIDYVPIIYDWMLQYRR